MADSAQSLPSLKDLASSDPTLRSTALTTITIHLRTRPTPLTPTQTLQLWRALHVALYMFDSSSPLKVQSFIADLSHQFQVMCQKNLPHPLPTSSNDQDDAVVRVQSSSTQPLELHKFTAAFWETISREYPTLDHHRLDKFLLLIRTVLCELFVIVYTAALRQDLDVDMEIVQSQLDLFTLWPLSARERRVPDGVRYHVLDVWVDELLAAHARVGEEPDQEVVVAKQGWEGVVGKLMPLVQSLAKNGLSKGVRKRAQDVLVDAESKLGWTAES